MKYIFCAFWLLVMAIGVTFAALNATAITVNYYLGEAELYLPFLLLIALVFGVLLGFVALLPTLIRRKSANRRLRQRIRQVEQEVDNLRAIPIKETH